MDTRTMTGAETFLRQLGVMGVKHIFASPGSEWSPVWEHLAKPYEAPGTIPAYHSSRHEETAIAMASGYAKVTGQLPAVMIHTTVGALHGAMAMRGALQENIPMVIFAGESVGFGDEDGPDPGSQWLRSLGDVGGPARLVAPCVKWSYGVNSKAAFPGIVQRACQIAMAAPRGPVFISLPMEMLFDVMANNAPATAATPMRAIANPRGITQAANMLAAAKQPVIITERAGVNASAVRALTEIATLLAAPVVEGRAAGFVNFPRNHPLHAGFDPLPIIKDADVIFMPAITAPWHPPSAAPGANTKVILLDDNPLRLEKPMWNFPSSLCLAGEIEESLEALLAQLRTRVREGEPTRVAARARWGEQNAARRAGWAADATAKRDQVPMDTRWVVHEMNQILPADAIVVDETITHHEPIMRGLDRLGVGGYYSGFVGGLGTGLGTALGVKTANPNRPVIMVIGDGSFNYNPITPALGFAQEHKTPIMIVLFNNQGYLSQQQEIPKYYPQGFAVKAHNFSGTSIQPCPEYAGLATLFGGYGEKVETPGAIRPAFERGLAALAKGQLVLLDLRLVPVPA